MIDGLLIYHLKNELEEQLQKARLEKIIQNDDYIFLLTFYRYGDKHHLSINLHPEDFSIYLTTHPLTTQINTQFSQSLKKELSGAILSSITQHETDRVIVLHFTSYDLIEGPIEKELVFEAMGKYSNLILTSQGLIIDTYKKMFFESGRQLLPHATFAFYPSDKKPFTSFTFDDIITPKDIQQTYMGLSRLTAHYLCEHMIKPLDLVLNPTIDIDKGDVYISDIFDQHHTKKYVNTISELFDRPKKAMKQSKVSYQLFIEKQIKKYEKKHEQLLEQQNINHLRLEKKLEGDLIYQSLLPLNEKRSSLIVDDQTLMLDPTLTLNENAQQCYQIYQKAKRGIKPIEEQITLNQQLLELFYTYQTYLTLSEGTDLNDLASDLVPFGYKKDKKVVVNKRKHKPNPLIIKDNDATYIIGKNDAQNDYITHQLAQSNDMWFHVKDAPGSHVVVQTNGLNEAIIRKAAMLAAFHSSLSLSSSIPVDYTQIKYLKKIPKTPGYRVTYTHQKTIFIDIDLDKVKLWVNL